ncbi:MAG: Alkaline phosphodiesterase I / Nucleotide pyrophosphatase, partial [uncultured Rubrobacteraceae bacterium]
EGRLGFRDPRGQDVERPERGQIVPSGVRRGNLRAAAPWGGALRRLLGTGAAGAPRGGAACRRFRTVRLPAEVAVGAVGFAGDVFAGVPVRGRRGAGPGARALRLLYGLFLGDLLLPPQDGGAEDKLRAVLAAGAGEPRLHERELSGAGPEGAARAVRAGVPGL